MLYAMHRNVVVIVVFFSFFRFFLFFLFFLAGISFSSELCIDSRQRAAKTETPHRVISREVFDASGEKKKINKRKKEREALPA